MNPVSDVITAAGPRVSNRRKIAPVLTLLLLAPMIAEVLSGATRLSTIIVLIPEIMVWGCGALLIREAVRRMHGGWTSMLVLGLALAVAEEFIIQQTSLAPLPWLGSSVVYGRLWGVNWVYLLFMLVYESVWVVLVPVQVTELIFAGSRRMPWLSRLGWIVPAVTFVLGGFIAWYAWTQQARPNVFHVPKYRPPWTALIAGLLAIALLVRLAYELRKLEPSGSASNVSSPRPWVVGSSALIMGFPWYLLMVLIYSPRAVLPFWIPLVAGSAWAAMALLFIRRWSSGSGWSDAHRWSLVFGATLVSMAAGFLGSGAWTRTDLIAKCVLNVMAVVGFLILGRNIRRRASAER